MSGQNRQRGSMWARVARLEAQDRQAGAVVILWPDGVRDGWGRPAKAESAAVVVPMPAQPMTPAELEDARRGQP